MKALTIKDLPREERPLERVLRRGLEASSDAELLALILRSGTRGHNALQLAQRILAGQGRDASALGSLAGREFLRQVDARELAAFEGIGTVRAHQILAALELGRRVYQEPDASRPLLNSPELVWQFLRGEMGGLAQEELRLLLLDAKQRLIRAETVAKGGLSALVIQPREILRLAVRANAYAMILAHNHPSGDPKPSERDIGSTRALLELSRLIGIPLQDHLIVCRERFCSLSRESDLWR